MKPWNPSADVLGRIRLRFKVAVECFKMFVYLFGRHSCVYFQVCLLFQITCWNKLGREKTKHYWSLSAGLLEFPDCYFFFLCLDSCPVRTARRWYWAIEFFAIGHHLFCQNNNRIGHPWRQRTLDNYYGSVFPLFVQADFQYKHPSGLQIYTELWAVCLCVFGARLFVKRCRFGIGGLAHGVCEGSEALFIGVLSPTGTTTSQALTGAVLPCLWLVTALEVGTPILQTEEVKAESGENWRAKASELLL